MPTDLYTKAVLTLIAGALLVIAWQGAVRPANAQLGSGCGNSMLNPCYVDALGLKVQVTNWPVR